jgi:hypothetical protein
MQILKLPICPFCRNTDKTQLESARGLSWHQGHRCTRCTVEWREHACRNYVTGEELMWRVRELYAGLPADERGGDLPGRNGVVREEIHPNGMRVYKAPGGNHILLGFKGNTTMDSSYFYAPYVPVTNPPRVEEISGQ